jgi:hypothetical protein
MRNAVCKTLPPRLHTGASTDGMLRSTEQHGTVRQFYSRALGVTHISHRTVQHSPTRNTTVSVPSLAILVPPKILRIQTLFKNITPKFNTGACVF